MRKPVILKSTVNVSEDCHRGSLFIHPPAYLLSWKFFLQNVLELSLFIIQLFIAVNHIRRVFVLLCTEMRQNVP